MNGSGMENTRTDNIKKNMATYGLQVRPNAQNGLWMMFLLPAVFGHCCMKFPQSAFINYKLSFLLNTGTILTSFLIIYQCLFTTRNKERKKTENKLKIKLNFKIFLLIPTFLILSFLTYTIIYNPIFAISTGILSTFIFFNCFKFVLNTFPKSFTIGEAIVVSQSLITFIYTTTIGFYKRIFIKGTKIQGQGFMETSTLILQVGLIGIALICFLASKYKNVFRKAIPFYFLFGFGCITFILIPLHVILKKSALIWIFQWIFEDFSLIKYMVYVLICCLIAMFAVNKQISEAKKASTITRKIFHVLAVLVFVPGLLFQCTFLYLASAVTLGIFAVLELIRILNVPPLGRTLQDGFSVFCDEKDSGPVALTPIYLLISVSLPIWIHPTPCDITDSSGFNLLPLLSGILSVGIGDTFASFIGKKLGRIKWPNRNKTLEGTLGYIFSQLAVIYFLLHFGFLRYSTDLVIKSCIAVVSSSIIEAFTTQVDNLALPLFTLIILL